MAKQQNISRGLSKAEYENLIRAMRDPFFFSTFIYLIHAKRGKVPFDLYPFQKSVLWAFLNHRYNIILKFRQAGVTELISMYCLWLAMFHSNKSIVIISLKDRVAKKVLRKIKYMYKNLPDYMKVDIVNGRTNDNGCITEDTLLIGEHRDFKIGDITPKEKGWQDIEHLQIKVLTHKGTFETVKKVVNKGILETLEIQNNRGQKLRCTDNHKLYTTKGWKFVSEILEKNLDVIFWDASYLDEVDVPITVSPIKEVIKETKYPGYYVSNLGDVYTTKRFKKNNSRGFYKMSLRNQGHLRVKLRGERNGFESVHRLVWETFNGPIPENKVIDHINCNRLDNYLSNLQCITMGENTARAHKYSRSMRNMNYRLYKMSLRKLGKLKALDIKLGTGYGTGAIIADRLRLTTKEVSHYRRGQSCSHIYVSKITLLNITSEVIVDMEVENNHSYITKSNFINHNTAQEMEFSNGSTIASIPTTEDAGRSESLSLLVIDEAAIIKWAGVIWAASLPTLSTGGSAIVNSCVTGDTNIITKNGPLRIDTICPKEFGKKSISHLGLEVLSHTGEWRKILGSVNKGQLETWEIVNVKGKKLKCTPDHKLLTHKGWKSVREIVNKNLPAIFFTTVDKEVNIPKTVKPLEEILVEVKGFPNYRISNWGKLYTFKKGVLKEKVCKANNWGYRTASLWHKCKKTKIQLNRLVALHFIGEIPENYVVDHINCDKLNDCSTNLEIVSIKENSKRGAKYSSTHQYGSARQSNGKFVDLKLITYIRVMWDKYKGTPFAQDRVIEKCLEKFGVELNRTYITKITQYKRGRNVYHSKIEVIRKYIDTIYDISVEEDMSYMTDSQYVNHNTPYGTGNWYHQTWVNACSKGNEFHAMRLRWQMHPERDIKWYNDMRANLGPRKTAQEIDGDFLTSGSNVFDLMDIRAIEDELQDWMNPLVNPEYKVQRYGDATYLQFKKPIQGEHYYIGGDIASGRSRDYSAFSIMNRQGEEFGCFKGKMGVDKFADLMMDKGKIYNNALLAPEGNDIGLAVVMKIQNSGYKNLYYAKTLVKEKGERRPKESKIPGWLTTKQNRPVIIDNLEEDIRNDNLIIKDIFFVQEAYTFIYDEKNKAIAAGKNKRSGAQDEVEDDASYTDDTILAKAITNHVRKGKTKSGVYVAPE